MSTPLYELTGAYLALLDQAIDEETGEVRPEFEQALADLDGTIEQKIEGCAKAVQILEADAEAINNEFIRLGKRHDSLTSRIDRLREYMRVNMTMAVKTKIKTPLFTISLSKPRESVVIDDEKLIPDVFMVTRPSLPDKEEIKKSLQNGVEVSGARLVLGVPTLNIR